MRGNATKRFLDEIGFNSIPLGCPSLHISAVDNLGEKILALQESREIKKNAIAAGNPWHLPSAEIEQMLTSIVDNSSGEFIIQHTVDMLRLYFGECDQIPVETQAHYLEIYKNFSNFRDFLEWYRLGLYDDV